MKFRPLTIIKRSVLSSAIALLALATAPGTTRPQTGAFLGGSSAQPAPAQPGSGLMNKNQAVTAVARPIMMNRD